jgi:hypothetical protein
MVDAAPLTVALQRFVAHHDGHVDLQAGREVVHLELRRDLVFVFDQLPDVLDRLARGRDAEAELCFPEAGSDFALELRRRDGAVHIGVRRGDLAGSHLAALPAQLPPVQAQEFVHEWRRCLNALLDAVARYEPSLAADPGYRAYRRQLNAIAME